ncbi:unnamed protein product [Amaranthus hypochondriacus]
MNTLFFQISSSFFLKSSRSIPSSSYTFYGFNSYSNLPWKSCINYPYIESLKSGSYSSVLARFSAFKCYSKKKSPQKRKLDPEVVVMKEDDKEKEGFFVVRKGDIIGVYKNFNACQAQVGSSITDPPVRVYKGFSLPKDAEEYLACYGLSNALYTIKASDLKDDIFGTLVPCPFVEPESLRDETFNIELPQKRPHGVLASENQGSFELLSTTSGSLNKLQKLNHVSSDSRSCILHFDGASKGNPGPAGAGVVLRTLDGALICRLRQGLGSTTNNAAEYHAIILGLKKALEMGYTSIKAMGDSKLVCMQLQGLWKVKHQKMSELHEEAMKLKQQLSSFEITHVLRHLNSDADAEANLGVSLADGQMQEVFE